MATHYETLHPADRYQEAFAVEPPPTPLERHLRPRKPGACIVPTTSAAALGATLPEPTDGASSTPATRLLQPAQWGLVPHWVKSASDAKLRAPKLTHAKADLASTGTAFRDAWLNGQRCIVPMAAFLKTTGAPARPCPPASPAWTANPWAWRACGRAGRAPTAR